MNSGERTQINLFDVLHLEPWAFSYDQIIFYPKRVYPYQRDIPRNVFYGSRARMGYKPAHSVLVCGKEQHRSDYQHINIGNERVKYTGNVMARGFLENYKSLVGLNEA